MAFARLLRLVRSDPCTVSASLSLDVYSERMLKLDPFVKCDSHSGAPSEAKKSLMNQLGVSDTVAEQLVFSTQETMSLTTDVVRSAREVYYLEYLSMLHCIAVVCRSRNEDLFRELRGSAALNKLCTGLMKLAETFCSMISSDERDKDMPPKLLSTTLEVALMLVTSPGAEYVDITLPSLKALGTLQQGNVYVDRIYLAVAGIRLHNALMHGKEGALNAALDELPNSVLAYNLVALGVAATAPSAYNNPAEAQDVTLQAISQVFNTTFLPDFTQFMFVNDVYDLQPHDIRATMHSLVAKVFFLLTEQMSAAFWRLFSPGLLMALSELLYHLRDEWTAFPEGWRSLHQLLRSTATARGHLSAAYYYFVGACPALPTTTISSLDLDGEHQCEAVPTEYLMSASTIAGHSSGFLSPTPEWLSRSLVPVGQDIHVESFNAGDPTGQEQGAEQHFVVWKTPVRPYSNVAGVCRGCGGWSNHFRLSMAVLKSRGLGNAESRDCLLAFGRLILGLLRRQQALHKDPFDVVRQIDACCGSGFVDELSSSTGGSVARRLATPPPAGSLATSTKKSKSADKDYLVQFLIAVIHWAQSSFLHSSKTECFSSLSAVVGVYCACCSCLLPSNVHEFRQVALGFCRSNILEEITTAALEKHSFVSPQLHGFLSKVAAATPYPPSEMVHVAVSRLGLCSRFAVKGAFNLHWRQSVGRWEFIRTTLVAPRRNAAAIADLVVDPGCHRPFYSDLRYVLRTVSANLMVAETVVLEQCHTRLLSDLCAILNEALAVIKNNKLPNGKSSKSFVKGLFAEDGPPGDQLSIAGLLVVVAMTRISTEESDALINVSTDIVELFPTQLSTAIKWSFGPVMQSRLNAAAQRQLVSTYPYSVRGAFLNFLHAVIVSSSFLRYFFTEDLGDKSSDQPSKVVEFVTQKLSTNTIDSPFLYGRMTSIYAAMLWSKAVALDLSVVEGLRRGFKTVLDDTKSPVVNKLARAEAMATYGEIIRVLAYATTAVKQNRKLSEDTRWKVFFEDTVKDVLSSNGPVAGAFNEMRTIDVLSLVSVVVKKVQRLSADGSAGKTIEDCRNPNPREMGPDFVVSQALVRRALPQHPEAGTVAGEINEAFSGVYAVTCFIRSLSMMVVVLRDYLDLSIVSVDQEQDSYVHLQNIAEDLIGIVVRCHQYGAHSEVSRLMTQAAECACDVLRLLKHMECPNEFSSGIGKTVRRVLQLDYSGNLPAFVHIMHLAVLASSALTTQDVAPLYTMFHHDVVSPTPEYWVAVANFVTEFPTSSDPGSLQCLCFRATNEALRLGVQHCNRHVAYVPPATDLLVAETALSVLRAVAGGRQYGHLTLLQGHVFQRIGREAYLIPASSVTGERTPSFEHKTGVIHRHSAHIWWCAVLEFFKTALLSAASSPFNTAGVVIEEVVNFVAYHQERFASVLRHPIPQDYEEGAITHADVSETCAVVSLLSILTHQEASKLSSMHWIPNSIAFAMEQIASVRPDKVRLGLAACKFPANQQQEVGAFPADKIQHVIQGILRDTIDIALTYCHRYEVMVLPLHAAMHSHRAPTVDVIREVIARLIRQLGKSVGEPDDMYGAPTSPHMSPGRAMTDVGRAITDVGSAVGAETAVLSQTSSEIAVQSLEGATLLLLSHIRHYASTQLHIPRQADLVLDQIDRFQKTLARATSHGTFNLGPALHVHNFLLSALAALDRLAARHGAGGTHY